MREWEERAGSTFLTRMEEEILAVGNISFTRRELVEKLGCGNFSAAMRLNSVLKKFFRPRGVRELARRMSSDELMSIKGVGVTTVYVWMAVLDSEGIDPLEWLDSSVKLPTLCSKKRKRKRK